MKRRIVVTGIGVIAPNGIGKENFWNALKEGKSGIKKITSFDPSNLPCQIAGEVIDFCPEKYIEDKKRIRRMSRTSQFAVSSAKMAVIDSGLNLKEIEPEKLLICIGVSTTAMDLFEREHINLLKKGLKFTNPNFISSGTPSISTREILTEFNIEASLYTVSTGCTSGLDAIGYSFKEIQNGNYDIAIAGGSDASITPLIIAGLSVSNIMSKRNEISERASRPFDKLRDGGVLSEGAGILIIEELVHALKRKANIYGEIIGYGKWGEKEITRPDIGFEKAMEICIKYANINKNSINCIYAHGPSDPFLDYYETVAIKNVFGEYAYKIPITSIKSMVGNPLGSGGVMQLIGSLFTLKKGIIPPTINYEYPDPLCDLDYTPNKYRIFNVEYCLINSHGIGGSNTSILVKKYEDK